MNKSTKIEAINVLIKEFKSTKSVADLKTIKDKIIDEITSCPFPPELFDGTAHAISVWQGDLVNYIELMEKDELTPQVVQFTYLSLAGLPQLVHSSLLFD